MSTQAIMDAYFELASPIVKHYREDIEIDKDILSKGHPTVFYLREYGTHATEMPPLSVYPAEGVRVKYLFGTKDRRGLLRQLVLANDLHLANSEVQLIVYFTGTDIKVIDADKAKAIVDEYVSRLSYEFNQQGQKP